MAHSKRVFLALAASLAFSTSAMSMDMIGNCELTGVKGSIPIATPAKAGQLTVQVSLPAPIWWNGDTPEAIKDGMEYCMAAEIAWRGGYDKLEVVNSDEQFGRLCRVISLTERRGYKQVEILLKNSHVLSDRGLSKIFRIIEQDEPSHWAPYDEWLDANGGRRERWWERSVDSYIHSELLFLKLPMLFLAPLARRARFADEEDGRAEPGAMIVAAAH